MRQDWMKQVKECAKIPCDYKIQIRHYNYYSGKYNNPNAIDMPVKMKVLINKKFHTTNVITMFTWTGSVPWEVRHLALTGFAIRTAWNYEAPYSMIRNGKWENIFGVTWDEFDAMLDDENKRIDELIERYKK